MSEKMNNKKFQEIINHFIEVVSKDKDIDLSTFYHNLETLNVVVGKKDSVYNSGYDNFSNEIYFLDDEHYNGAINHELFHCASTKVEGNISHSGFYEYNDETKEIYGLGINEGYTEILHQRFFGAKNAYSLQKFYITKLEQIIDPDMLKKMYFASDLNGLVDELSKYTSLENISHFMYCLDIYTLSQNTKRDDLKFTFEQIQEAISYCSSLLSDCYIQKLIKDNPDDIKKQAIDYLNGFNKEITHNNNAWNISIAVPIDVGYEILDKIGIEKPKDLEVEKMEEKKQITYQDLATTFLEDTGLSVATVNRLYARGIRTLADVFCKTDEQLLNEVRNFGTKRLEELHSVLAPYEAQGLYLGMTETEVLTIGMPDEEKKEAIKQYTKDLLSKQLDESGLYDYIVEHLKQNNITTIEDLVRCNKLSLSRIPHLYSDDLKDINDYFERTGTTLHIGMTQDEIKKLYTTETKGEEEIEEAKDQEDQIVILHEEISELETQKQAKEERLAVLNQLLEQKRQLEEQNRALDEQIAEVVNMLGIDSEMSGNGKSRI